jgi:hypothetical protein
VVGADGIKMDPEKIEAITKRKPPTNAKLLLELMGMTGYHRKFIKNYAHITAPWQKLLKKESKWKWDDDCQEAFDTIMRILTEYPILRPLDFKK